MKSSCLTPYLSKRPFGSPSKHPSSDDHAVQRDARSGSGNGCSHADRDNDRSKTPYVQANIATCIALAFFALMGFAVSGRTAFGAPATVLAQEITTVDQLRKELGALRELWDRQSFIAASELVNRCSESLAELVKNASETESEELKTIHQRLISVRELLAIEGAEIVPLESWESLTRDAAAPGSQPTTGMGMASEMDSDGRAASEMGAGRQSPRTTGATRVQPSSPGRSMGSEISFVRDVAPWLIQQCGNCHISKSDGGFNMSTFDRLSQGVNGSVVFFERDVASSRIVEVIESGDMPRGGGMVSPENLDKLKKWIEQGAKFDGDSRTERVEQVTSKAWASDADPVELQARRVQQAREKWQIAAPRSAPTELLNEHFHIIGNVNPSDAEALLTAASEAEKQLKKLYGIRDRGPLIKGGATVFAFRDRYAYGEFGTMLERRSLPSEWSSHWRRDPVDAYVTLVFDGSNPKINELALTQQLASLWAASFDGAPKWFAEGVGRQSLALAAGAKDGRVQAWTKQLPESMKQVTTLRGFLDGSINDEDYATIGFGLIRLMIESGGRRQYDSLLRSLASGQPFEQAMVKSIGPTEGFLQQALGKTR